MPRIDVTGLLLAAGIDLDLTLSDWVAERDATNTGFRGSARAADHAV